MQGKRVPEGDGEESCHLPQASARPFFSMSILLRAKWLNLDEKNNS